MAKPVVVEENNRKFTLNTSSAASAKKIRIDGGVIKSHEVKKCDFMISVAYLESKFVYLVELKGSDIPRAIEQLESTIHLLSSELQTYNHKEAHAVCSRVNPAFTTTIQINTIKFRRIGFALGIHSDRGIVSCKSLELEKIAKKKPKK